MANPIDIRKKILSAPLRRTGPRLIEQTESSNDRQALAAALMLAYAAIPVFAGNILLPAKLIDSGFRGQRTFSHLSYVNTALGFPMPRFNYVTPASKAYRTGASIGKHLGVFLSPTLHDVTFTNVFSKTKTIAKGSSRGARIGAKVGGKVGARLIPGLGWAMLAYDAYDIAVNRSLWGFDF